MYKVIIETADQLPPHNSQIFQIKGAGPPGAQQPPSSPISQCGNIYGQVHLFRDLTIPSQGLFSQIKSRSILISNCYTLIQNAIAQFQDQVELYRTVLNNHKIDGTSIGQTEDVVVIFKTIAMAQQIVNFVREETDHTSVTFYLQTVQVYPGIPFISQESYIALTTDESGKGEVWIELPTCIRCLDLLEQDVTGISAGGLHYMRKETMGASPCKVCWTRSKGQASCMECDQKQDTWICMICGAIGCGRYKKADAYKHYASSKHFLSLDLQTNMIWNYRQDCFSHKVVGKEQASLEMLSGNQNTGWENEHLESAFWKYCCVVSEQLDRQRNFYKKIQNEEIERLNLEEQQIDKRLEQLAKGKEQKLLALKRKVKKNKKTEKKMREMEEKCGEERALNANLEEAAKSEHGRTSSEVEKKRRELESLEKQISEALMKLE